MGFYYGRLIWLPWRAACDLWQLDRFKKLNETRFCLRTNQQDEICILVGRMFLRTAVKMYVILELG